MNTESALYTSLSLDREKVTGEALRRELFRMIEDAADNASDTCLEHGLKVADEEFRIKWAEMFQSTLESLSTDRHVTEAARRWLVRREIVG